MLCGLGSDTVRWALGMSFAVPPTAWQIRQLSSATAPPVCSVRPFGAGLTKLMLSWHALQARALRWLSLLSPATAPGVWRARVRGAAHEAVVVVSRVSGAPAGLALPVVRQRRRAAVA